MFRYTFIHSTSMGLQIGLIVQQTSWIHQPCSCFWKCVTTKVYFCLLKTLLQYYRIWQPQRAKTVLFRKCTAIVSFLIAIPMYQCDAELIITIPIHQHIPFVFCRVSQFLQVLLFLIYFIVLKVRTIDIFWIFNLCLF